MVTVLAGLNAVTNRQFRMTTATPPFHAMMCLMVQHLLWRLLSMFPTSTNTEEDETSRPTAPTFSRLSIYR